MGRLLDYLLIIILVLYLLKALVRYLLPAIFQSVINNVQEQQNQNQRHNYNSQAQPDPKVKVDYIPEKPKGKVPDSEGDFIDYEEIK